MMETKRPTYRPPRPPSPKKPSNFVFWRRRLIVIVATVTLIVVFYLGISLAFALTNQSYGASASARAAEWGRQHGFGGVVTWIENEYYSLNPPKKGGRPSLNAFGQGPTQVKIPAGGHLAEPSTVPSPAGTNLKGEGVWHAVGRSTITGIPAEYESFVRVDPVHTSFVAGLVWMDTTLMKAQLYSGSFIPGGGPFKYSAPITANASKNLVSAFNAGFRMQDANGGYYTDGKTLYALRKGAASVVIFKDGTMSVGQWGRDFTMTKQVASVRQNLDLIVDDSKLARGLNDANSTKWGTVIGNSIYVWRSGIGELANGAIVYAGGPSLSVKTLATILLNAGCVRAMELDINTDWVQYSTFSGALNTPVNGSNGKSLLASMAEGPSRYFATWENRDFFTMTLRKNETIVTAKSTKKK